MAEDQEDQDQDQARRAYLVETFGPDVLVGLATDPAPTGTTKSALAYEKRRRTAARDARLDEARETISAAAQLDADRRAYDRVMDQMQAGQEVTAADLLAAGRHAHAQGLVPPQSSAEKLAG
jgi:hypothetical protein